MSDTAARSGSTQQAHADAPAARAAAVVLMRVLRLAAWLVAGPAVKTIQLDGKFFTM